MVGVQQIKQLRLVEQLSQVAAPDKEEGFRKLYPRVDAQQRVSPAYERVTKQKSSIKRRIKPIYQNLLNLPRIKESRYWMSMKNEPR